MAALLGLMAGIPWLSPKGYAPDPGGWILPFLAALMALYFAFLHALMLAVPLGYDVDFARAIAVGVAVLIMAISNVLGKVERNFYVGIRTPWTLASERVWIETHRLAAWLGVACGAAGVVLALVPAVPPLAAIVIPAVGLVYPVLHSLVLYKRLQARGELEAAA